MEDDEVRMALRDLQGWIYDAQKKEIRKEWKMKDFMSAVRFINKLAELAESEGHHPDVHLTGYRRMEIALSTHSIGGISSNDFIMAAKIDDLPKELKR
jgi:4a-hydroxytetrahydrobiopterin dehydratase